MPTRTHLAAALLALALSSFARADEIVPPFAGHNCYSDLGEGHSRGKLSAALRSGLRAIEVDVNHSPTAGGFVVTHDGGPKPRGPLLDVFLQPLWKRWSKEAGEHILIIDFKAGSRDDVPKALYDYLGQYRDKLCTYKPDGSRLKTGPVKVCLTGSKTLDKACVEFGRRKGELLALRDGPTGAMKGGFRQALRDYLARAAEPGVGYLTLNWRRLIDEDEPPASQVDWLREVMRGARGRGYLVRVYTLNVIPQRLDGQLVGGDWDATWRTCVRGGIDMIATDNYRLAVRWWREIGKGLAER